MELKLGSIAAITNELAEKLTGELTNNKLLVTVVTDNSTVLRSIKNNKTYNVRNEVLLENIKWYEDKIDQRFTNAANNVSLPESEPESEPDNGEFIVMPVANGKLRIARVFANTAFTQNVEDPYADDPYGDIYG